MYSNVFNFRDELARSVAGDEEYTDTGLGYLFSNGSQDHSSLLNGSFAKEEFNSSLMKQMIDFSQAEKVFMLLNFRSDCSIQNLFKALKIVAYIELMTPDSQLSEQDAFDKSILLINPFERHERLFALQKMIEVADVNIMVRPRLLWSNIWADLYRFFLSQAVIRIKIFRCL